MENQNNNFKYEATAYYKCSVFSKMKSLKYKCNEPVNCNLYLYMLPEMTDCLFTPNIKSLELKNKETGEVTVKKFDYNYDY